MTYAPAAPEFERLPWLTDDSKPAPSTGPSSLILWSVLALIVVAGASYWLGLSSSRGDFAGERQLDRAASATIALPDPMTVEPKQEEASRPKMPKVEPVAAPPPVPITKPRSSPSVTRSRSPGGDSRRPASRSAEARAAARAAALPVEKKPEPQALWPAATSEGAAGRAVRIGTFASRRQAKLGWRHVVRAYPGMGRLQAVVVPSPSLRNGRTYYRLQFGTTSQAHSTILCQWMRRIAQSCVVIGQPAQAHG